MTPVLKRLMLRTITPLALAATTLSAAGVAVAQEAWPAKQPIRVVVGFAPGGTTDVLARILSQPLSKALGQTIVIDNKPGASGNIAAAEVIRATPNGHTLLIAPTSFETANPSLFKSDIKPSEDLVPVAAIGRTQMYLVSKPDLPAKDARDLVELARKSPGTLAFSSSGTGTPPHLACELFKKATGTNIMHIPYRGAAPALQDVLSGQVDFVCDPGIAFPHIRTDKVKLLGIVSATRSPFFPDAPTVGELGFQDAQLDIWFGMWAPKGVAPEIIERLGKELEKALAEKDVQERYHGLGAETKLLDAKAFRQLLDDERKLLAALIEEQKINVE